VKETATVKKPKKPKKYRRASKVYPDSYA